MILGILKQYEKTRKGIALVCIIALATLAVLGTDYLGKSSRRYAAVEAGRPTIVIVNTPAEAYRLWKSLDVRGRVIFHFGRNFFFKGVPDEDLPYDPLRSPVFDSPLIEHFERRLADENALWMASKTNIARTIINIVPMDLFQKKLDAISSQPRDNALLVLSSHAISVHDHGFIRTMTHEPPPPTGEPVILLLDASYFDSEEDLQRVRQFQTRIAADVITICLSEGQEKIDETARVLARRAEKIFSGGL